MPPISVDKPPAQVEKTLGRLRAGLDATVPTKRRGANLLVGTWNVRAFGRLTEKWESGAKDSPKRNLTDICAIAEIVSRFDVVAVQETRDDLSALHRLMERLGSDWSFIITDIGEGEPANGERLAWRYARASRRFRFRVNPAVWLPATNSQLLGQTGSGPSCCSPNKSFIKGGNPV